ncbi:hypothetical protein FB451DRAFT_90285 [Mycena latifolia]|nr:hypothetical protein FB451DRAFT_90285 [Mycena latifolia]
MSKTHPTDDTFELFDLRVEVICPPGERILCGAKEGDHFTLEGRDAASTPRSRILDLFPRVPSFLYWPQNNG